MKPGVCTVNRSSLRLLLVLLSLGLGACAPALFQGAEQPQLRSYLLDWSGNQQAAAINPEGPRLLIAPVRAAAGFESSDMVYIRHPHQLEHFANHRWVDAPARMLEPLLLQAALDSGLFKSVAASGSGTQVDLRLDTTLLQLQQVCAAQASELQMSLRVQLVDVAAARLLASELLSISEPLSEAKPAAGVEAANRALAKLMSQLQVFLGRHLPQADG